MNAKLFAVVGPSGAGKDTLMQVAAIRRPDLHIARRVITRPAVAGGEDFDGVSEHEFASRSAAGEFALSWQAHGLSYGIPTAQLSGAKVVLFNGSRAVLQTARDLFADLRVIEVTAPSELLAQRLAARGRETADDVLARLKRASFELPQGLSSTVVVNDGTLDQGVERFLSALQQNSA
jgi:ribose 1,5-bisphosphokinase